MPKMHVPPDCKRMQPRQMTPQPVADVSMADKISFAELNYE
jgi:hypothetical protein